MAKLTEEAKQLITELYPGIIATAGKDGMPNVAAKGSFRVVDDEHVAFADMASPRTVANLRENPQISAMVFNNQPRKGCRIWGKAEILDSGDLFNAISAEYEPKGMKVKHVVKIKVEEVVTF